MSEHRQVPVKVNAYVDEGVAGLVSALATVPGLITVDSCQGRPGRHEAWVMFRMLDWRGAGEVLFDRIMPALSPELKGRCVLKLEGFDKDYALGSVSCDPSALVELTTAVRQALTAAPVGVGVLVTPFTERLAVTQ